VAEAVTDLGHWEGRDVHVPDVLVALERLRRSGERTATRTSVVTLVAVAEDAEAGRAACDAMHVLGGRHPGRTIVLVMDPGAAPREGPWLDAEVHLHPAEAEGVNVWSEDVILSVRGSAQRHLDSVVEPLALPDLPLALWYVSSEPRPGDPLVDAADVVLVDSKELGGVTAYPDILQLARRRTVSDLSWVRLTPWRLVLGSLFEGQAYRPFVHGVHAAVVRGKPGPRHLLAGWLISQLDLPRRFLHLEDARHAAVHLAAEHEGRHGEFRADRADGARLVRASASVDGGPHHEELRPLPDTSLAWSLARALSVLDRDPVYEEALAGALELAA
jgi:glucose-6-phosphate dehydrogenase assembly protein OpcA